MSNSTPPDLEGLWGQLIEAKSGLKVSQYTIVASATFFIYDILLTFEDELELVWRRSLWTFPALLYIGNRYVTLACVLLINYQIAPFRPVISKSFCKQGISIVGFSLGVVSWGGIMVLRVAALWKTRRVVVWIVWLSWLCTVVVMSVGAIAVYLSLLPTLVYDPVFGVCTGLATTHVQIALPAIQAAFVLILTFFTVAKAYQFPSHLRRLKDVSQMMSLLLRDGVVYFLVVSILSIVSGVSWMILPAASSSDRIYLFVYLNWTIFSTLVARLFLRLRKMFYRNYAPSANPYSPSLYSTTIAWNSGSAYIDHVIEHDASRFFQDDEFAVISIRDPGDAESFLPTLDINISMALLSLPRTASLERIPYSPRRDRPTTSGSSRPRTANSAAQILSGEPQTGPCTSPVPPKTGLTSSPRTGGSMRPQTASGLHPATAGKTRPFSAGP